MLQVYQLQQEFGGASFVTASRLFVKEGDLFKVQYNNLFEVQYGPIDRPRYSSSSSRY